MYAHRPALRGGGATADQVADVFAANTPNPSARVNPSSRNYHDSLMSLWGTINAWTQIRLSARSWWRLGFVKPGPSSA